MSVFICDIKDTLVLFLINFMCQIFCLCDSLNGIIFLIKMIGIYAMHGKFMIATGTGRAHLTCTLVKLVYW